MTTIAIAIACSPLDAEVFAEVCAIPIAFAAEYQSSRKALSPVKAEAGSCQRFFSPWLATILDR
jgi:hypothetical protein